MGVAAYQRGSALVRAQIERDLGDLMRAAGERAGRANREDRLNDKIEMLTVMIGDQAAQIESLKSQLSEVVGELVDERAYSSRVRQCCDGVRSRLAEVSLSWRKCSAMLRCLSPVKVHELREIVESLKCQKNG